MSTCWLLQRPAEARRQGLSPARGEKREARESFTYREKSERREARGEREFLLRVRENLYRNLKTDNGFFFFFF